MGGCGLHGAIGVALLLVATSVQQGQSRSFLLWCLLLCAVAWTDAGVRHEQAAVLGTNYPLCLLRWRCWLL